MVRRTKERGFTVVELLVAIGLFGLVMPSIILSMVAINRINDRAADLTYANIIAENKIESLRSSGFNALNEGTVDFSAELPATFTAPRTATYTVTTPTAGLKRINISIAYNDQGTTRTLEYSSLIGELGVAQ